MGSGAGGLAAAALLAVTAPAVGEPPEGETHGDGQHTSRISDESVPQIKPGDIPSRPSLLLELGNPLLGSGSIDPGFVLPGGAVAQPSLWVFGTYRSALQVFNQGLNGPNLSEWANRLDLFANLQLSGTERVLFGVRPFDESGTFSGYQFSPDGTDGTVNGFNFDVTTLFFEGDIGEMIPDADPKDSASIDWGISVGRQPLFYQEGMLIDEDIIDAVGITRNTLLPAGGSDLQLTFLYGWGKIGRNDNVERSGQSLFGLFSAWDFPRTTINADIVYVHDDNGETDGVFFGLSGVQRIGHFNTSFRVLGSHATGQESPAVTDGYLLFTELSWTPPWTEDNAYINAYWGIDDFSSAARGAASGGPLGRVGIMFAAVGLGRYGAPLGNRPNNSVGGAIGRQWFFDDTRKQFVVELGSRYSTDSRGLSAVALGARYQQAMGRHWVLQLDAFGSLVHDGDEGYGARAEIRYEF